MGRNQLQVCLEQRPPAVVVLQGAVGAPRRAMGGQEGIVLQGRIQCKAVQNVVLFAGRLDQGGTASYWPRFTRCMMCIAAGGARASSVQ